MDRLELQKLRDLPIEGVAERLGLHVVRHKALCPFHDDHHASLSFKVNKNTFRC
ncbi:MAG: DNA primase, partial [Bacteroidales bacterium]|nr:DNA primase [Bacteroidales bacterium]